MQKLPKLRVDYSRLAVTWLRYFKRYINVHAISEWLQPCRTQVPWMGDVVVAYGPSAGLGRQKENSGFRCFDGWNWAVLSCNIEQLLLFSYEVILVALEKNLLFPHIFASITCCGLEFAHPNWCCLFTYGLIMSVMSDYFKCKKFAEVACLVLVSSWGNLIRIRYFEKYNITCLLSGAVGEGERLLQQPLIWRVRVTLNQLIACSDALMVGVKQCWAAASTWNCYGFRTRRIGSLGEFTIH